MKRECARNFNDVDYCILFIGRVTRTSISEGAVSTEYHNILEHGIASEDLGIITRLIREDLARCRHDPQNFAMWLLGDFTPQPHDHHKPSLLHPEDIAPMTQSQGQHAHHPSTWQRIFRRRVEVDIHDPSILATHHGAQQGRSHIQFPLTISTACFIYQCFDCR